MICKTPECGTDMGKGEPFAAVFYVCTTCGNEHTVNTRDVTEYLVNMQRRIDELEALNATAPLPALF